MFFLQLKTQFVMRVGEHLYIGIVGSMRDLMHEFLHECFVKMHAFIIAASLDGGYFRVAGVLYVQ